MGDGPPSWENRAGLPALLFWPENRGISEPRTNSASPAIRKRKPGVSDAVGPSPIQKRLSTMQSTRPRVGWMTSEAPPHPPAKERLFRRGRQAEAGPRRAGAAASEGLGVPSGPGGGVSSAAPGAASSGIAAANRSGSRSPRLGGRPGAPREERGQGRTERRREVIHPTPAKPPGHAGAGARKGRHEAPRPWLPQPRQSEAHVGSPRGVFSPDWLVETQGAFSLRSPEGPASSRGPLWGAARAG